MPAVLVAVATTGALTFVLASLLILANRKLHVPEDPRIDVVEDLLPAANCGACGFPGCRPFAEALVGGDATPGKCTVSPQKGRERIAAFLGVDVGAEDKRVARLACAGATNVARNRADYVGLSSCAAAAQVAGGGKGCFWGCLGLADCEVACDFDAIHMNRGGLPVVDEELCTACGDCVTACPKNLFSIQPQTHRLWVACSSLEHGDELLDDCRVACTACARCAKDAPNLVMMSGNLPMVNYPRLLAKRDDGSGDIRRQDEAIQRCPTGAIVWIERDGATTKGASAKKIIRVGERMSAPT